MQLNFAFRLSLYLTLALAAACLGYAELAFLPEISGLSAIVGILLCVAFYLEGRWSLSIPAANVLGGFITALLGIWFGYQFLRPSGNLLETLPWPTSLLPYFGPVMMVAMVAKLFRPKYVGDFWALQGIGLTLVALGCALANDLIFGLLFVGYLIAGVWSLTLFYLYRETYLHPGAAVTRRVEDEAETVFASDRVLEASYRFPTRFPWIGSALRWVLGIAALAMVMFLITPRSPSNPWELSLGGKGRMEVGYTADTNLDLTRTGTLSISNELALTLTAHDAQGNPKNDLNPAMRFRGRAMHLYANGNWRSEANTGTLVLLERTTRPLLPGNDGGPRRMMAPPFSVTASLPDYGPYQFFLTFKLDNKMPGEVLADPVVWFPRRPAPIVTLSGNQTLAWVQMNDGSFTPLDASATHRLPYQQVTMPVADPQLGPLMRIDPRSIEILRGSVPKGIGEFTDTLISRLISEKKLPPDCSERDVWGFRLPRDHEQIAKAIQNYLARSGEFTYSLKIERIDRDMDPIEDFLKNVRHGHCNRYASALALMLRSQGIPTQIVLGFSGMEHIGEGEYEVYHHNAHAWVEALIERRDADPRQRQWQWLTLDPTPDIESTDEESLTFMERVFGQTAAGESLADFIIGYSADKQQKTTTLIWARLTYLGQSVAAKAQTTEGIVVIGLVFVLIGLVVWYFARGLGSRQKRGSESMLGTGRPLLEIQRRLWELLRRAGYEPSAGQTPLEFAHAMATILAASPPSQPTAAIPEEITQAYYRHRYGEQTLTAEELTHLETRLDLLQAQLRRM